MSTPYVRRPILEGNTDVPVQAQPYLQGTVRKTSAGVIPGFATLVTTDAADLVVESDLAGSGPITIVFTPGHSDLLADIITTINSYLVGVATASERDGCLRLQTDSVGETTTGVKSFIRVHPATNDYLGTGIPQDCAPLLGFACYPDPSATVTAGDIESAATRPIEQGNLPGTRFVARGEDRTSAAFNRALSQLALNADVTRTAAIREAYYPVAVELDFSAAYSAGWLRFDVDGKVTQVSLAALPDLYPALTGRAFVGDLSNTSTLREIAKYWGIVDAAGRAVAVYDEYYAETRTLRVGAVTRGEQGFGRMYFPDEDSAPTSPIVNTQYVVADGRNALGVSRLKQPITAITEIRGKTNVVCGSLATPAIPPTSTTPPAAGVGFLSHGVAKGDIAVISGAAVTSPFCHNGMYYVEDVVSEQELILRPLSDTDVEALNPSDSGAFGSITIYSSAEWEAEAWVTLDPPLARFPDNKLVLLFGIERETLNQREDVAGSYTDTSAVSPKVELTAFQGLQFWQRQSLAGAYAGMSADRTSDAGSVVKERARPITLVAPDKTPPSAGVFVRGPFSGSLVGNGVLAASGGTPPTYDDTFTIGDVGRVVKLSGGALLDLEPFMVIEFIDGAHVRLAALGASPGSELSALGAVDYEVYDEVVDFPSPLLSLIAPEQDRDGNELADVGVLYIREQNDSSVPPAMTTRRHGRSLVHLERVSVGYSSPGVAADIRTVEITATTATTVTVDANVELFQNIFAVEGGDDRPVEAPYNGGSIFRIMNGPNAGFYLIQKTTTLNALTLRTLDGDSVPLDTTVSVTQIGAFYNAHISVGHTLSGTGYGDVAYRTAKLRVFFDSLEQGEQAGAGISLDWRGQGAGIVAQLNDADFVAYDSEAGAIGYVLDAKTYSPAHGINLAVTGADSGEAERRSARGLNIQAEGHQLAAEPLEWGMTGPEALTSWGAHVHQAGEDAALIITKGADIDADYAHPSGAALQVRLEPVPDPTERVYRAAGTAIDVTGSIYLRRPFTDVEVTTPGGAFYSETGFSAAQYVVPFQQPYTDPDRDGTFAFDTGMSPTQLGNPDLIYPALAADPAATVSLLPPDSALFAFHHIGVVRVPSDAALTGLLSSGGLGAEKYIGSVIEIDDAFATGTVTVASLPVAGNTIVIGGVVLTATTGVVGVDQFLIGATPSATAANIAAAINAPANSFTALVTATSVSGVVTLRAVTAGASGASITLSVTGTAMTASDSTLFSINAAYTVVGIKVNDFGFTADFAVVRYGAFLAWSVPQTGRSMRLYGRRWHQAYLNVADFALLGTWDTTASRTDLPAITSVAQVLNDRHAEAIDDSQFPTLDMQTLTLWSPVADGASLGFDAAMTDPSMADVDVTAATYTADSTWTGGATAPLFSHGWARATGQPRSPFPNRALFSGGSTNDGAVVVDSGSLNSAATDDYTAKFTAGTGAAVYWSEKWGGTLAVGFTSGASATAQVYQRGRTYVLGAHLALKVRVRIAGGFPPLAGVLLTLSLRRADGTIVAQPAGIPLVAPLPSTPQDREYTITVDDLYKGAKDALNASLETEALYLVLSISTSAVGAAYVLEFAAEQQTRPAVVSGPQVVAGAQLAHTYRFTDPVRGFQTLSPIEADMLCGPYFGLASGDLDALYTKFPDATGDHIGVQERDGMPGRIKTAGGVWNQMVAPKDMFFSKGMHAAAITMWTGVYDPVFCLWKTSDSSEVDLFIHPENFQLPGKTGFVVPLNPPHGALLTSLALSMSFRPTYDEGVADNWGVFSTLYADGVSSPGVLTPLVASALSKTALDTAAGVRVELWRHNTIDIGVEEEANAEFSEEIPPYGFSEQIARITLSLKDTPLPAYNVNEVNASALPSQANPIFAGTEHFERRNWDLLQVVSEENRHVLRVDRRHYSYYLVITFWGGPRRTTTYDGTDIYRYADTNGWDPYPSVITGTATPGSALNEPGFQIATALPGEYGPPLEGVSFPPQVKFRGARLGWVTDRAGDGGW